MDFSWKPEDEELYQRALAFAGREAESNQAFSREVWDGWGEFGFLGLCIPQAFGGLGLGAVSTARVAEAFGRAHVDTGRVFSALAHLFACAMPVVEHASPALKDRYLPGMASGRIIGANAITEAEAGTDVFSLKTRAVRDGDGYLLTGTKSYVTNAPVADVFLVYAQTAPEFGFMGLSAFLVERGTPGLEVGKPFEKIGLHGSPISSVYLEDCRVPASARVGEEGQGGLIFNASMRWERGCLFAAWLGVMERLVEQSLEHARSRRQFGKPIGKNQAVSHRIVEMKLRLESSRLLLYRACWEMDQGRDAEVAIALSKLAVSEAAVQTALDAIQVQGGMGVVVEAGIEQTLRDAIPSRIFSGTSDMQREFIARRLGL